MNRTNKIGSLAILISILALSLPQLSLAAAFSFEEDFNTGAYINPFTTTAIIRNGSVLVADGFASSVIESTRVGRTSYDVAWVQLRPDDFVPVGAGIEYFVSNDDKKTWLQVRPHWTYELETPGRNLYWKAVLRRSGLTGFSPQIDKLTLNYWEGGAKLKQRSDDQRIRDLGRVADTLVDYFEAKARYPDVKDGTAKERWERLSDILSGQQSGFFSRGIPEPIDAIDGRRMYYDYFSAGNKGNAYILAVELETQNHRKLDEDIDGSAGTINCADPVYCIGMNVEQINASRTAVAGTSDINITGGNLVRLRGDYRVFYITEGGFKRHVPSEGVFLSYGNKWENVIVLPAFDADVLNRYPDNKFVFLENQWPREVYLLDFGQKHFVPEDVLARLRLQEHEIAPVNQTEFNSYPIGVLNMSRLTPWL